MSIVTKKNVKLGRSVAAAVAGAQILMSEKEKNNWQWSGLLKLQNPVL